MESTITTKGQITLPKALRNILHLKSGDKVIFEEQEDGNFTLMPKTLDVSILKGCISFKDTAKSIEDMDNAISENAGR